jgi:hypothetical protein
MQGGPEFLRIAMKVRIEQAKCNQCYRKEICPEQNDQIQVVDYVEWMQSKCPQYPKK